MKRILLVLMLVSLALPSFALPIRYEVEGTYKNYRFSDNLLIPAKGTFSGWFEFDPDQSSFQIKEYGANYYTGGFTFNLNIGGIPLYSDFAEYFYDPSKPLTASNVSELQAWSVKFDPWSIDFDSPPESVFVFFNEDANYFNFYFNPAPCCIDRYYEISAKGHIKGTVVSEPSSAFLLLLPFSGLIARRLLKLSK